MQDNTVFPGFMQLEVPLINSTNLYAEELISREELPEGSLIFTPNQYDGIGHAENKWESEPFKNLTVTVLLKPVFLHAADQFFLTIAVSLSVCDLIEELIDTVNPFIKWPNDIFVNHRKIAGVLIKNQLMGSEISTSIVGVGLNINQMEFKKAPNATSLKILSGEEYAVTEVLTKWHKLLYYRYTKLKDDRDALLASYLNKMYLKGKMQNFIIRNVITRATIQGIDRHGLLVLLDEKNNKINCELKEIVFPLLG